jgi:hypothetical protein
MKFRKLFSSAMILASLNSAFSSEVDPFTDRHIWLAKQKDETVAFNKRINELLVMGMNDANDYNMRHAACDTQHLIASINFYLGDHLGRDTLYFWMGHKGPADLTRGKIYSGDTVYRDFKWYESISLAAISSLGKWIDTTSEFFRFDLTYSGKVETYSIGGDKFTHFFNRGKKYYRDYYYKKKPLEAALFRSYYSEASLFGSKSTGIASYGDLASNFQGMRFWNEVAADHPGHSGPDVITGEMPKAYFVCGLNKNGRRSWKKVRDFDLRDYADAAWDEGHNCSLLRNEKLRDKVVNRILELEQKDQEGRRYTCPIDVSKLHGAKSRYGKFYHQVVNENGHGFLPEVTKADEKKMELQDEVWHSIQKRNKEKYAELLAKIIAEKDAYDAARGVVGQGLACWYLYPRAIGRLLLVCQDPRAKG